MFAINDVTKENDENFHKVVARYSELLIEASQSSDTQYKLGRLALFQEAKKFFEIQAQYKYIPFTEMVDHLQRHIDKLSGAESGQKQKELNLTGVKIKQKKKRLLEDSAVPEDTQNEHITTVLQRSKKEKDCLNLGPV